MSKAQRAKQKRPRLGLAHWRNGSNLIEITHRSFDRLVQLRLHFQLQLNVQQKASVFTLACVCVWQAFVTRVFHFSHKLHKKRAEKYISNEIWKPNASGQFEVDKLKFLWKSIKSDTYVRIFLRVNLAACCPALCGSRCFSSPWLTEAQVKLIVNLIIN